MSDLTYVIADLHGRADLLSEASEAIARHAAFQPAGKRSIVTLGDYVDRGPQSKRVIDILMRAPNCAPGFDLTCLRGNHEQMMIDHLEGRDSWGDWIRNGGDATLASYTDRKVPDEHLAWLKALPMLAYDEHRLYVHADIDPKLAPADQKELILLWSREKFGMGYQGKHVIVGHTPKHDNPITIGGRTDLDTGAYESGRLAVAIFDDAIPGGPDGFLHIQGAAGSRRIHQF
jgi:serine/threonine protein phosphatase 1